MRVRVFEYVKVQTSRGFYMGKHEITQGQWKAVMGSNPSEFNEAARSLPVNRSGRAVFF